MDTPRAIPLMTTADRITMEPRVQIPARDFTALVRQNGPNDPTHRHVELLLPCAAVLSADPDDMLGVALLLEQAAYELRQECKRLIEARLAANTVGRRHHWLQERHLHGRCVACEGAV